MTTEYARLLWDTHADVALGHRDVEDARAERFLRLAAWCGEEIDGETAAAISRKYRARYLELRRPVDGAPDFLRSLRGSMRISVVTNNTLSEQTDKLAFLGLRNVVDDLVTSEEVGAQKPDPAIFRAALRRVGATTAEAVMIGDSWTSDIEGARDAGVRAIWFNRFGLPQPSRATVPEFASFRSTAKIRRLLRGSPLAD